MTTAAELFALQETDLAIDTAMARLSEVEAQLGETEELLSARRRVEDARETAGGIESRRRDLDLEAEGVRAKASEIEKRLYGGTVRNPKELEDLQADLQSLKGRVQKRDDALLDVMLELDDAESALDAAESALAGIEAAWETEQASLRQAQAELKAEIEAQQAKREREVDGMDRAALSLYGAIRERRQGAAVAVVERGLCQGCRITLPMSVLQKARSGVGLVQCVSCERILLVS